MAHGEIEVSFVFKSDSVFVIKDINPQAPTHLLLIPVDHHENAAELANSQQSVLAELFEVASRLASESQLDGYRTVFNTGAAAGQSVFHAHLHLLGGRPFAWPPG
jgi:histidine triad (HIT) family protein